MSARLRVRWPRSSSACTGPGSSIAHAWGGTLNDLDVIWNQAADHGADGDVPEGTPPGIEQLASLLRVYNSAMGGGLGFALEVNEPFRVRRAINAFRYFELDEAADFLQDVLDRSLNGELPDSSVPVVPPTGSLAVPSYLPRLRCPPAARTTLPTSSAATAPFPMATPRPRPRSPARHGSSA